MIKNFLRQRYNEILLGLKNVFDEAILAALEPPINKKPKRKRCNIF